MFLEEITFKEDIRVFKKGDAIKFKDNLTVITGDNGAGKSTMLGCIRNLFESKWSMSQCSTFDGVLQNQDQKHIPIGYIDLALDLHSVSPEIDFDNFKLFQQCRSSSSGEGAIFQLVDFLEKHVDKPLIIIDEPEKGLSILKQRRVASVIKNHTAKNPDQQILLTTHSEHIMIVADSVLSMTHGFEYMDTISYLEYMLTA